MSNAWHPDEELLIPWTDGELDTAESLRIDQHVAACGECRQRAAEVRETGGALRRVLPAPPQPWPGLESRLAELDAGQIGQKPRRRPLLPVSRRWMAAAASVLLGIFAFRLATETTLSAAELLRDATAAERRHPAPPSKRLKVRTKTAIFVRPARGAYQSDVAQLFAAARYDWSDPLSARSFASWRDSLPEKDDRVRILHNTEFGQGRYYRVTTATSNGVLAEASITIRAEDLHAVHETFRFRNQELVEITEGPDEAQPVRPLPSERLATAPSGPETSAPEQQVTPADELKVLAALHAIGADLGEPVEVFRNQYRISVTAIASASERQRQIRNALSGMPFVDLSFEDPEPVASTRADRRIAEAEAPRVNAFIDLLISKLGSRNTVENFTNHVLDLSEAALARAHALRRLAERFPPDVEAALPPEAAEKLAAMRQAHADKLLVGVRQLTEVISPVAGRVPAQASAAPATWQEASTALVEAARHADRSLTNALAGTGEVDKPEEALRSLAGAAGELQIRAAALSTALARSGARH